MVRLSLFWEHELYKVEDGCVGVMSLFREQVANLPSASAMRSTLTTKFFVFGSNGDAFGKPSSKFKFGNVSISVAYVHFYQKDNIIVNG